jgi:ferritin-like metal-binding protein YciE
MKIDSLNDAYLRELDAFYDAVDLIQEGLLKAAAKSDPAELYTELELQLTQMLDLGNRLERIFFLVNQQSLRIVCKSTSEVGKELFEKLDREGVGAHSTHLIV